MTEDAKGKKGSHGTPAGYINIAGMCELFGRSPKTIRRLVGLGTLPSPLKFGRQDIWDRKEVDTWLKNAKFCK